MLTSADTVYTSTLCWQVAIVALVSWQPCVWMPSAVMCLPGVARTQRCRRSRTWLLPASSRSYSILRPKGASIPPIRSCSTICHLVLVGETTTSTSTEYICCSVDDYYRLTPVLYSHKLFKLQFTIICIQRNITILPIISTSRFLISVELKLIDQLFN